MPEQLFCGDTSVLQGGNGLSPCLGRCDGTRERELRDIVDDAAQLPCPAGERLQFGEIRLPNTVAAGRRHDERGFTGLGELATLALIAGGLQQLTASESAPDGRLGRLETIQGQEGVDLAMPPRGPLQRELRRWLLDTVTNRSTPRATLGLTLASLLGVPIPR